MAALARAFADYIIASEFDRIPAPVRHEGTRALINWFGCALGGCRAELIDHAAAVADQLSGPRDAAVLGRGQRVDVVNAAFLNCFSSSLNAFDDTHLLSIAHPTGPVAAVALALAEQRNLSGRAFLHAVLIGIEVECRMACVLMEPPGDCSVAFTMTGLVGGIGAAAAAGKLLGLDATRLTNALGIAAIQAAGFREGFGTMTRDLPMAQSARSGLIGALFAEQGFTTAETTLDGPRGLAHVFAGTPNLAAGTRDLGERYELMTNAYKPYPCGIVIHPVIDACLDLALAEKIDWRTIASVKLKVHPDAIAVTGKTKVLNGLSAQVNVYHWAAATLVRRRAGLEETDDAAARDPDIAAVRDLVTAESDPSFGRDGAAAEVVLKDGRCLSNRVEHCRGSAARPMTDGELEAKTRMQARGVLADAAVDELVALCWDIEHVHDLGARIHALFPERSNSSDTSS
jgi:2-methylcitrate dehydratase PrpD